MRASVRFSSLDVPLHLLIISGLVPTERYFTSGDREGVHLPWLGTHPAIILRSMSLAMIAWAVVADDLNRYIFEMVAKRALRWTSEG